MSTEWSEQKPSDMPAEAGIVEHFRANPPDPLDMPAEAAIVAAYDGGPDQAKTTRKR
ncbi:hypothetical protein [Amycolatopsis sp. NPDC051371]|uniref:hypothetical protein n=1 Tax=Amycolatopsis sp. NPDC051371 TaxID=3155800 RepID=UPI0034155321